MPLVTCPDCGKEVSDTASACIGCGRPMEPAPAPPEPSAEQDSSSTTAWECPKCGGEQFKKFSLLYEEQRSTSTFKTTAAGLGLGAGGLGVGVGGASSKGISMTDLARRVSPPDKNALTESALRGCVVPMFTVLGMWLAFLVFLVSGMPTEVGGWTVLALGALIATWLVGRRVALAMRPSPGVEARFKAASRRWNPIIPMSTLRRGRHRG